MQGSAASATLGRPAVRLFLLAALGFGGATLLQQGQGVEGERRVVKYEVMILYKDQIVDHE